MKKSYIAAIIIVVVVATALFAGGFLRRGVKVSVQPLVKLNAIPAPLTAIFDFGDVKPYNVQKADFAGGASQYILNFVTGHMRENYDYIKKSAVEEHKFTLEEDTFDAKRGFTLNFKKDDDRLSVEGVANKDKPSYGAITITLYTKT